MTRATGQWNSPSSTPRAGANAPRFHGAPGSAVRQGNDGGLDLNLTMASPRRVMGGRTPGRARRDASCQADAMTAPASTSTGAWVVVGIDNGGTANNATVLTPAGDFLVANLVEVPSRVNE